MKPSLLFPALVIAVAMFGCQADQSVIPTSTTPEQSTFTRPIPINDPVEFSYILRNPYKSPEQFLEVNGRIQFELRESPILSREMYELSCFIDGEVYSIKPKDLVASASAKSFDNCVFAAQHKYVILRKTLDVYLSQLPLSINIEMRVYRSTLEVSDVWLSIREDETE